MGIKKPLIKISSFLLNKAKIRLIVIFLALLVLKFMSLPYLENLLHIKENTVSIDKPYFYTPNEIYGILTGWGDKGRSSQFIIHITWDLLLPIIYFFFLGFLISWLTKRGFNRNSKFQRLNLVSLVAVVDLLENISLFILIIIYPAKSNLFGWAKTGLTLVKYYLFGPAILFALITSLLFALKNKFKLQG